MTECHDSNPSNGRQSEIVYPVLPGVAARLQAAFLHPQCGIFPLPTRAERGCSALHHLRPPGTVRSVTCSYGVVSQHHSFIISRRLEN